MSQTTQNVSKVGSNITALEDRIQELSSTIQQTEIALTTLPDFRAKTIDEITQMKKEI